MGVTLSFNTRRAELAFCVLYQLEYRPVLSRWRTEVEAGFIAKFLCFVVRGIRTL
ncbi:hypothetical protein [Zavarzinia sp. CC-PAN008]|uniref:hypothetical protein n=1 Tax=Zavarzinia sp. CC-PAN008 TaxID=3243332 RepID=UPI003F7469CA